MPRLGIGRAVNFAKRHPYGVAAAGAIGLAAGQVRPFQPISEAAQAEVFGDPNGIQTLFGGSVKSAVADSFLGGSAERRIQEMRTAPGRQDPGPSYFGNQDRYAPDGALVLGMYKARNG